MNVYGYAVRHTKTGAYLPPKVGKWQSGPREGAAPRTFTSRKGARMASSYWTGTEVVPIAARALKHDPQA